MPRFAAPEILGSDRSLITKHRHITCICTVGLKQYHWSGFTRTHYRAAHIGKCIREPIRHRRAYPDAVS